MSFREDIAGYVLTRFTRNKNKSKQQFSIGKSIEESSGVLLCLPEDRNQFRIARYVFKGVLESPVSKRITVILHENVDEDFRLDSNVRKIVIKKRDMGFWKVPKSSWIKKQGFSTYDLVVDLNTNYHLYAAYLSRKLGDGLIIGFAWDGAEEFYNVLLEMKAVNSSLENIYRTIRDEYTNLIPLEDLKLSGRTK
ncbi:MAG: hypothetical protein IIB41_06500 [Candidatus Marinimicrobia bacterium]|nr:hypothetical protein [Candidatus Neomarinimicrobiota bacterium]